MHVVCELRIVQSDRSGAFRESLEIRWREGANPFPPYRMSPRRTQDFQSRANDVREHLHDLSRLRLQNRPADQVAEKVRSIAEIGAELADSLFLVGSRRPDGTQAREVRNWLRRLQSVDPTILEISYSDDSRPFLVPWNVLYEGNPGRSTFITKEGNPDLDHYSGFWGVRYVLASGKQAKPTLRDPLPSDSVALLVACPRVANANDWDPDLLFGQSPVEVASSLSQLKERFRTGLPHIIYWLSHADEKGLWLDGELIDGRKLRSLLQAGSGGTDDLQTFRGLAILNACRTAAPRDLTSYLQDFQEYNYSGIIATEAAVIDRFAVPFGESLLQELFSGRPIGELTHDLRSRPDELPLSLLYGTYCPPHFRMTPSIHTVAERVTDSVGQLGDPAILGGEAGDQALLPRPVLPDEPYRPLAPFEAEHRALLAGRERDVSVFVELLDDPACRVLLLHGASGVGKSSFLKAGVIPCLEDDYLGFVCLADHPSVAGPGSARDLFVRATSDPFMQIARRLLRFCAKPFTYRTPTDKTVEVDQLSLLKTVVGCAEADEALDVGDLRDSLASAPERLSVVLNTIGESLPYMPVLIIDQAEEIFTLSQQGARSRAAKEIRNAFLRSIATAQHDLTSCKIVLSMRTEYHGRMVDGIRGTGSRSGVRDYLLTDLGEAGVLQVLKLPTSTTVISGDMSPRQKYGFTFADGVAERAALEIAMTGHHDGTALLGQVIGAELWRLRESQVIDQSVLTTLTAKSGDTALVEGALRRHTTRQIEAMFSDRADRQAVWELLDRLSLRQADGTYTTAHVNCDKAAVWWTDRSGARASFESMLEQARERRLVRLMEAPHRHGDGETTLLSLGHDALGTVAAALRREREQKEAVRETWGKIGRIVAAIAVLGTISAYIYVLSPYWIKGELSNLGVNVSSRERNGRTEVMARADGHRDVETKKVGTGNFKQRDMVVVGPLLGQIGALHVIDFDDLATLETFDIRNVDLGTVKTIELGGCERLVAVRLPALRSLESLSLNGCFLLDTIEGLELQSALMTLDLSGCVELDNPLEVINSLPARLQTLAVGGGDRGGRRKTGDCFDTRRVPGSVVAECVVCLGLRDCQPCWHRRTDWTQKTGPQPLWRRIRHR